MDEYLVPTAFGEDEFVEKKSRFIGRIWPVETEEEALRKIQEMKKKHYDATHNCWAYVIRDGAVRFSDDAHAAHRLKRRNKQPDCCCYDEQSSCSR